MTKYDIYLEYEASLKARSISKKRKGKGKKGRGKKRVKLKSRLKKFPTPSVSGLVLFVADFAADQLGIYDAIGDWMKDVWNGVFGDSNKSEVENQSEQEQQKNSPPKKPTPPKKQSKPRELDRGRGERDWGRIAREAPKWDGIDMGDYGNIA